MEFAVIETGGKQYKITAGQALKVEKLPGDHKEGDTVTFDKVLLMHDGKTTKVGTPYIKGASVSATFEGNGRNKKVVVIKYKAKSRYFKKRGHKQPHAKVKITAVK
jgi:large subunit ribosomal protein L21